MKLLKDLLEFSLFPEQPKDELEIDATIDGPSSTDVLGLYDDPEETDEFNFDNEIEFSEEIPSDELEDIESTTCTCDDEDAQSGDLDIDPFSELDVSLNGDDQEEDLTGFFSKLDSEETNDQEEFKFI